MDKQWEVDKRYNEFFDLENKLLALNYEMNPEFAIPKKTYFPVRNQNQLNHRREQLAKYMKNLAS
jgi:hypothetical protein